MKLTHVLAIFITIILFSECKKEDVATPTDYLINGFVQKGPFLTGAKIIVTQLDSTLKESGKTFIGTTADNKGSFSVSMQGTTSNFISVNANGVYFDEVGNSITSTPLTLTAIADISSNQKININVLTNLEVERVKYLITKGNKFAQAKAQAEKEILKIFLIDNATNGFETLDISQAGNDNAALLAISVILQGMHTVAQLTDLMTKISADIKSDGTLDTDALKSELINEAQILNTSNVRNNILKRYSDLGVSATLGAFETIIENFKTKSGYAFTKKITYPALGSNGKPNLLAMSDTVFETTNSVILGLSANLPVGTSLNLVIRADTNTNSVFNFNTKNYGGWNYSQVRTIAPTIVASSASDAEIIIDSRTSNNSITSFTLEVYENGATAPTRTIKVKVSDLSKAFALSAIGKNGVNFLNPSYIVPNTKGNFSVQIAVNDTKAHEVKLIFDYITPAQNGLNFSNLENWAVFNEVLSGQKYLYRMTLILPASKNNGDALLNINGFGQMSLTGTVDGVAKNAFAKTYDWQ